MCETAKLCKRTGRSPKPRSNWAAISGYYLIEADSIDAAASIAAGIPAARYGSIEVRPIMVFS
ncbi:MAG TPA: YciI family protein [Bryobacteraceae bacterium]|nr:YciI family protein [Bryobacteraceae bacterium]